MGVRMADQRGATPGTDLDKATPSALEAPDVTRDGQSGRVDVAAHRYRQAADVAAERLAVLKDCAIQAVSEGMSESEAARRAGFTRMTIRAWLGKADRPARPARPGWPTPPQRPPMPSREDQDV